MVPENVIRALPAFLPKGPGSAYRISEPVLADFNADNGLELQYSSLSDSDGANVAGWLLDKTVTAYTEAGIPEDWSSAEYASLVALGYMTGRNGVIRAYQSVAKQETPRLASVFKALQKPQLAKWAKRAYDFGRKIAGPGNALPAQTPKKGFSFASPGNALPGRFGKIALYAAALFPVGYFIFRGKKR